jgi:hypothetical protein
MELRNWKQGAEENIWYWVTENKVLKRKYGTT